MRIIHILHNGQYLECLSSIELTELIDQLDVELVEKFVIFFG